MGGGTQYMPLKVNYPGVMPIIFGQALLLFPASIAQMLSNPFALRSPPPSPPMAASITSSTA